MYDCDLSSFQNIPRELYMVKYFEYEDNIIIRFLEYEDMFLYGICAASQHTMLSQYTQDMFNTTSYNTIDCVFFLCPLSISFQPKDFCKPIANAMGNCAVLTGNCYFANKIVEFTVVYLVHKGVYRRITHHCMDCFIA